MKPFLAWPGWRHLVEAAVLTLLLNVLFAVVYFGANSVTAHRSRHLQLFLRSELAIPLWPAAIVVYDSLYLLVLLAPFVLRTSPSFRRLARSAAVVIVVAGVCFLLLPGELGFAAPLVRGPFRTIFEASDKFNLDYNLVPSLHVALAVVCLQAFWPMASRPVRVALAVWGAGLAVSTLLTHQHHVLDVVTGGALAVIATRLAGRAGDVA